MDTPEGARGDLAAAFFDEAVSSLTSPLTTPELFKYSELLTGSLRKNMEDATSLSMLPSFIHDLPTGQETGRAIAIDIGGSTMRFALVDLYGQREEAIPSPPIPGPSTPGASPDDKQCHLPPSQRLSIVTQRRWEITQRVKELDGELFFDWIALNVKEAMLEAGLDCQQGFRVGLGWSFPLEQTSLNDGRLREMGKGFKIGVQLKGRRLKECLDSAFARTYLSLELDAIINDSIGPLLALAYTKPRTGVGLVVGTGFNASIKLPARSLTAEKYGQRPSRWRDLAKHVLVDTELCVTGRNIFHQTVWDDQITALFPRPDSLALEQWIGGFFMAEIVRRILLQAAQANLLFGGNTPEKLRQARMIGLEVFGSIEA
ncbi:Hexokinase-1 [Cladophialophora carrionii]|uniref:Phosphotransferase n=1 Tax=Cladophialophora carrionii TaxID=86049 RepID=A0A1C1CNW9_9EURO|nr:Hexokinase-1 [Cladophialophora carrionii]